MRISDWSSDVCSSDLSAAQGKAADRSVARAELVSIVTQNLALLTREIGRALKDMGFTGPHGGQIVLTGGGAELRSEEHTSELQSLMRISYAVFCLKKKRQN